jgi:AraC family transcriptional activator of mtrCDE
MELIIMIDRKVRVGLLSQIKPTVNFANRMTASPGQDWGPRTIPDCQLVYIISGHAKLILGPQTYLLSAGDCVFYGIDSPHWLISSESDPFTFTSIHYSWDKDSPDPVHPVTDIRNAAAADLGNPAVRYIIHVDGHGEVEFPHYFAFSNLDSLFLQIVREYRFEEYGYSSVLRGLLTQLLTVIIRHQINGQYSSAARRKIAPALEAIRKQPHIAWKTTELANLCGYHPTYFAALFYESTGHSPKHFIILERIRKAKQLLLEAESIEAVADQLGYASVHYFSRNFKSVTGLTPTQFKQQSLEL